MEIRNLQACLGGGLEESSMSTGSIAATTPRNSRSSAAPANRGRMAAGCDVDRWRQCWRGQVRAIIHRATNGGLFVLTARFDQS